MKAIRVGTATAAQAVAVRAGAGAAEKVTAALAMASKEAVDWQVAANARVWWREHCDPADAP